MRYTLLVALLFFAADAALASPQATTASAAQDVLKVDVADREFMQYFWLPHDEKDRENFKIVFKKHLNMLSREPEIAGFVEVTPILLRIDIRDFDIDRKVLEKAKDIDFFFHARARVDADSPLVPKSVLPSPRRKAGAKKVIVGAAPWLPAKEIALLVMHTQAESPILNAEWFFVQSARQLSLRNKETGLGYFDVLKVKDRDAFFQLVGLDEKASIKAKKEIRAALDESGVSAQNRQIVRLQGINGGVWITLDTDDQSDRGIAIRNLKRGDFLHKAEELYAPLPNGLPATFLCNDQGVRQESAPDFIGPDDSSLRQGKDGRIHSNISCIRCHQGDVLKPVDDWVRDTYRADGPLRLQSPDKKLLLELKRQYFSDLNRALKRDREDYQHAIALATATKANPKGLTAKEASILYAKAWNAYVERPVTVAIAARELGVTPKHLLWSLKAAARAQGSIDPALAGFLKETPKVLKRPTWEDAYPIAAVYVQGFIPVP